MSTDTRTDIRQSLCDWIAREGLRRRDGAPAADADLVQDGWLDSLGLMTLISHVEDLLGRPLHDHEMRMHHFVSVDAVARHLFASAAR